MKTDSAKKNLKSEIATLNNYEMRLAVYVEKGSRKQIKHYAELVEAQARWIAILVEEIYSWKLILFGLISPPVSYMTLKEFTF